MIDVVAVGELLIDFIPCGEQRGGGLPAFQPHAGGAPANVLVALSRFGKRTAFIGKVGDDPFGKFVRDVLMMNHVDASGLVVSAEVRTTLAFVHLDDAGERSFSFYRHPGADQMLTSDDVDLGLIRKARVLHFGSVSLTDEPSRSATLDAVQSAKQSGLLISYDPNHRPLLWKNEEEARRIMSSAASYADVVKVSHDELSFLTETSDLFRGTHHLVRNHGVQLALVTLGSLGCFYRLGERTGIVPTYRVTPVDSTAAGDAFLGTMLALLLDAGYADPGRVGSVPVSELEAMIRMANAAGALTTTVRGAIPAIPSRQAVLDFVHSHALDQADGGDVVTAHR